MMRSLASPFRASIFRASDDPELLDALQEFRKGLFVDTLGWNLRAEGNRETDEFDTDTAVHCALFRGDRLVGGFRAIRADEPYLAMTVFPQLATIRGYPRRRDVWEISRFGVLPSGDPRSAAAANYALMFHFGRRRNASAFVAITDLTYERYLRVLGIKTRRYGPPQVIGADRFGRDLLCVAGEIPLADQADGRLAKILALADSMEIRDATIVRGPAAVSA